MILSFFYVSVPSMLIELQSNKCWWCVRRLVPPHIVTTYTYAFFTWWKVCLQVHSMSFIHPLIYKYIAHTVSLNTWYTCILSAPLYPSTDFHSAHGHGTLVYILSACGKTLPASSITALYFQSVAFDLRPSLTKGVLQVVPVSLWRRWHG